MFKKILVPVNMQHKAVAARILKQVDQLAEIFDAEVHVTTVMPGYGMPLVATYFPADAQREARKDMAANLKKLVRMNMNNRATTSVSVGRRSERILTAARRRNSDLLIIGCSKKSRNGDLLLGSCGTKLATLSPCSVLTLNLTRDGRKA